MKPAAAASAKILRLISYVAPIAAWRSMRSAVTEKCVMISIRSTVAMREMDIPVILMKLVVTAIAVIRGKSAVMVNAATRTNVSIATLIPIHASLGATQTTARPATVTTENKRAICYKH